MKWVRAYDKDMETSLATDRSIVYDPQHCEPYWQTDPNNFYTLFDQADDDIVLCEWDIALGREDRRAFERHILDAPQLVHVAPYKHYAFKSPAREYSWLHRRDLDTLIVEDEPDCMLFGFGLVYIPLTLMKQYLYDISQPTQFMAWIPYKLRAFPDKTQEMPLPIPRGIVRDTYFSQWHWTTFGHKVPVHWDVRPVHLHYDAPIQVFSGRHHEFEPFINPALVRPINVPETDDENPRFA